MKCPYCNNGVVPDDDMTIVRLEHDKNGKVYNMIGYTCIDCGKTFFIEEIIKNSDKNFI